MFLAFLVLIMLESGGAESVADLTLVLSITNNHVVPGGTTVLS